MIARTSILMLSITLVVVLCGPAVGSPVQSRDHLTPQEIDLIKDTQVLDKRIEVFIKAADRRVLVLNAAGTPANAKQLKKDSEAWGELPVGTRAELINDLARILDEAITNIDDVSSRDEKNPLIPKALRKLSAAATRIIDQLKPLAAQARDDLEASSFGHLMENAESIVQAANKLTPEAAKKGKASGEKPKTN